MSIGLGFEKLAQKLGYFGDFNSSHNAADQLFSSSRCWLLSLVPPLLFGQVNANIRQPCRAPLVFRGFPGLSSALKESENRPVAFPKGVCHASCWEPT